MRLSGHITCTEGEKIPYRVLLGKQRKRLLEGPKRRCDDNIKMDIGEINGGMD
jgi:hypothetical protein